MAACTELWAGCRAPIRIVLGGVLFAIEWLGLVLVAVPGRFSRMSPARQARLLRRVLAHPLYEVRLLFRVSPRSATRVLLAPGGRSIARVRPGGRSPTRAPSRTPRVAGAARRARAGARFVIVNAAAPSGSLEDQLTSSSSAPARRGALRASSRQGPQRRPVERRVRRSDTYDGDPLAMTMRLYRAKA